ncbi:hypothetical protein [Massilia sp. 9096]|uniref:hypothetical protein n=1 Tax=Massilia sp. 9096 TaxID=1500894 RepID=UPI0018CDC259|nr:hypothetical protein [Massilia sp. 9096]
MKFVSLGANASKVMVDACAFWNPVARTAARRAALIILKFMISFPSELVNIYLLKEKDSFYATIMEIMRCRLSVAAGMPGRSRPRQPHSASMAEKP